MIISKFGGSSLANIKALTEIKKLSLCPKRKVFVFSAIGKNNIYDTKLTDTLIALSQNYLNKLDYSKQLKEFCNKINFLKSSLKIDIDLDKLVEDGLGHFYINKDPDYLISRGEYITTLIMSKYLKIKFVPAEKVITFNKNNLDFKNTAKKLKLYLSKYDRVCIPGFYGKDKFGKIHLFPRGGGDITGAVIAKIIDNCIYENWTDIDGIKQVNPNIVKNSKQILHISYKELSVMTKYDTTVFHSECSKILKSTNVITYIKNIFNPLSPSTRIDNENTSNNYILYKCLEKSVQIIFKLNSKSVVISTNKENLEEIIKTVYEKIYI